MSNGGLALELNPHYVAGIIDGEGSISVYRTPTSHG